MEHTEIEHTKKMLLAEAKLFERIQQVYLMTRCSIFYKGMLFQWRKRWKHTNKYSNGISSMLISMWLNYRTTYKLWVLMERLNMMPDLTRTTVIELIRISPRQIQLKNRSSDRFLRRWGIQQVSCYRKRHQTWYEMWWSWRTCLCGQTDQNSNMVDLVKYVNSEGQVGGMCARNPYNNTIWYQLSKCRPKLAPMANWSSQFMCSNWCSMFLVFVWPFTRQVVSVPCVFSGLSVLLWVSQMSL